VFCSQLDEHRFESPPLLQSDVDELDTFRHGVGGRPKGASDAYKEGRCMNEKLTLNKGLLLRLGADMKSRAPCRIENS